MVDAEQDDQAGGSDSSAPDGDQTEYQSVFRELDRAASRTRGGVRRFGRKAYVLGRMARAGLPVPDSWVLGVRHYDEFVSRSLPRKHDLRSLIKLVGTRAGDDRCARAYEEMLASPLPVAVVNAARAMWAELSETLSAGVVVRPSLAASGAQAAAPVRHLHSLTGVHDLDSMLEAIRRVWASSVLSSAVAAYAEAEMKDVSVGLIVQRAVDTELSGVLTRTTSMSEPMGAADWHLGVLVQNGGAVAHWRRRAQLLLPLSQGEGGRPPPQPLDRLRAALGPAGFEKLIALGQAGERELGRNAVLHFVVDTQAGQQDPESQDPERQDPEAQDTEAQLYVLNADETPRWLTLAGGDAATTWVEVVLATRDAQPAARLSQSVLERSWRNAVRASLATIHCKIDSDAELISGWCGRSYLNLTALVRSLAELPLATPEDLLLAVGGAGVGRLQSVAGEAAGKSRTRRRSRAIWKTPLVSGSTLAQQIKLEREVSELEQGLARDSGALADMDLTILPNDAMATTLSGAEALLERSIELWLKCAAAQLAHQLALQAIIKRRVPDADPATPYLLCSGAGGSYWSALAIALQRVADVFDRDPAAAAMLDDERARTPRDLPDGPGRGALGQFLLSYGDVSVGAFELSRPRWREDARDVMAMLALMLRYRQAVQAKGGPPPAQPARVLADTELARFEPSLSLIERRLARGLIDRCRLVVRMRHSVDRQLFRSLAQLRRVVLDIDRRLRRIDPSIPKDGAFACSAARLVAALKSGRPELKRVIAMRRVEQAQQALEPAPPLSFVGAPPRGGIPIHDSATLAGLGVSPGVVDGRARLLGAALPVELGPDDVLIVPRLDPALVALYRLAGAVVTETGGALSMAAEAARELGVVVVASVQEASLHIAAGERLRVDGGRGSVQRLDALVEPSSSLLGSASEPL